MALDPREIEENDLKTRERRRRLSHAKRNDVDVTSKLLVACIANSDFTHL